MTSVRPKADGLLATQEDRWRAGERVTVEHFLTADPTLYHEPGVVLDLIYGEVLLRRAAGEQPHPDEYAARFPTLADKVRDQFDVDAALAGDETLPPTGPYTPVPGLPTPPGYELFEEIGRGGMGVVYRARQTGLDRVVALKLIRSGDLADPTERARFAAEARAVARLSHPNIVQVYEVGEVNGCPFLALEYVPGGTLANVLTGLVAPAAAAALVATLARAVQHAHEQGIVHRDLKPANVLMSAGCGVQSAEWLLKSSLRAPRTAVKITDFGLAKLLNAGDAHTPTGDFLGTPNYAAPEQVVGAVVGPAADVHALGGILYHLLVGRPPFAGTTVVETLDQVRFVDPVAPSRLRPGLPRDLETIALTCLHKDPARRYTTAAALAEDLNRYLSGRPILARPVGTVERAVKWARRRPAVAGLTAALAVLLVAAVAGLATLWQREAAARAGERTEREKAEAARAGERAERERAERRSADLMIANARLSWLADDFAAARATLVDCPPHLRNAAWAYLDLATTPPVRDLTAAATVKFLAYRGDGRLLAGLPDNGRPHVWDVSTGRETADFTTPLPGCRAATFTPAGQLRVVSLPDLRAGKGPRNGLEVYDIDPMTAEARLIWHRPVRTNNMALSPGGTYLATVGVNARTIHILDGATGDPVHDLTDHFPAIMAFAFASSGRWLATIGGGLVRVFDPAVGKIEWSMPTPPDVPIFRLQAKGIVADGRRIAFGQTRGTELPSIAIRGPGAAAGPEMQLRYAAIGQVAVSQDGGRLAVAGLHEREVGIWDLDTRGEGLRLRAHPGPITALAFSPDGRFLAVACAGGRVAVWKVLPETAAE
jgi:eukaryotic-like serine/threonine-protein kinase